MRTIKITIVLTGLLVAWFVAIPRAPSHWSLSAASSHGGNTYDAPTGGGNRFPQSAARPTESHQEHFATVAEPRMHEQTAAEEMRTHASDAEQVTVGAPAGKSPAADVVEQLRNAFESEPRSASAEVAESKVENAFRRPTVPEELFKSVSCHTSVCRVDLDWSPDRMFGYLAAAGTLTKDFGPEMGFMPMSDADPENRREVHVYFRRRGAASEGTQPE